MEHKLSRQGRPLLTATPNTILQAKSHAVLSGELSWLPDRSAKRVICPSQPAQSHRPISTLGRLQQRFELAVPLQCKGCAACEPAKSQAWLHSTRAGLLWGCEQNVPPQCKACATSEEKRRREERAPLAPQHSKQAKACTRCREEKDIEQFCRNSRSFDGRYSQCRTCVANKVNQHAACRHEYVGRMCLIRAVHAWRGQRGCIICKRLLGVAVMFLERRVHRIY